MNINAGFPSAAEFSGACCLLGTTAGGANPPSRMQLSEECEISGSVWAASSRPITRVCQKNRLFKVTFWPSASPDGSFFFARLKDASSPLTDRLWRAPDISRYTSRLRSVQHLLLWSETERAANTNMRFNQPSPSACSAFSSSFSAAC